MPRFQIFKNKAMFRCFKNSFLLIDGHFILFVIKNEAFYRSQKRPPVSTLHTSSNSADL